MRFSTVAVAAILAFAGVEAASHTGSNKNQASQAGSSLSYAPSQTPNAYASKGRQHMQHVGKPKNKNHDGQGKKNHHHKKSKWDGKNPQPPPGWNQQGQQDKKKQQSPNQSGDPQQQHGNHGHNDHDSEQKSQQRATTSSSAQKPPQQTPSSNQHQRSEDWKQGQTKPWKDETYADVGARDISKRQGATCSLPTDDGNFVPVTPDQQNKGFAMAPNKPCNAGMYCPYACKS
jgi:hypothetical protein